MGEFWAGAGGAVVGAVVASALSYFLYLGESARRRAENRNELRRTLTVELVRALADYREVRSNPSANAAREREVFSALEAGLALFTANLRMPREIGVREYVTRVKAKMFGDLAWLADDTFQRHVAEPLLRWSVRDSDWPDEWFEELVSVSERDFVPGDVPPSPMRRAAVLRRLEDRGEFPVRKWRLVLKRAWLRWRLGAESD